MCFSLNFQSNFLQSQRNGIGVKKLDLIRIKSVNYCGAHILYQHLVCHSNTMGECYQIAIVLPNSYSTHLHLHMVPRAADGITAEVSASVIPELLFGKKMAIR